MRIIVTGGTGLIGQALSADLSKGGHKVIILTRNPRQHEATKDKIQHVKWDAQTSAGWGHLADGADAIVNLAGESLAGEGFLPTRWSVKRKQSILNSRVNAGNAVVEAVQQASNKPKVVIQASAVGYYGVHEDEEITEASPPGNDFLAEVCKAWEHSSAAVAAMGVRHVIIRTGIVLTTKDGALPRLALPFKLFAGGPLGSGRQQMPWIHIDDEVAAIRFLIENDQASGGYNLSAPNPVSNKQFANVLGKVLHRPSFMPTPGFAFKIAFGEVSMVILEGQRAVPKRLLEAGFQFRFASLEAALRDLFEKGK
jgi:uncharacterized protein (TIGR01777 family)